MLKAGGYLNIVIAIGHLVGLIWANAFFEVTGIGKEMKEVAQVHASLPYLITVVVAVFFFIFGIYGLSDGYRFGKLPCQKLIIFSIAGIYLLRGVFQFFSDALIQGEGILLGSIYSAVAFTIGILYLWGGIERWKKRY